MYIIHSSYYSADCINLHKTSKSGQHWAYASHFIICSVAQNSNSYIGIYDAFLKGTFPIDRLVPAYNKEMWNSYIQVRDKTILLI